ncbi:hypothetical protein D9756_011000 [Leucocoprinus leucothites]|uniref:Transposase IS30-like HTH domain-containing protein n=1 Tax=Leucocoprinus leucothites TaxID=201217 RepID=A0A8H5CSW8_9AGAR|nr:hypothetical protein D9756_011000 [Leucoagaricus leucothites]
MKFLYIMVYTFPPKVACIAELHSSGMSYRAIGSRIDIDQSTVGHVLKRFSKSEDPYYVKPRSGHPQKLDECQVRVGAQMLA